MTVIAYRSLFLTFACFFLCTQITLIGGLFWVGRSVVSSADDINKNLNDINKNLNILQKIHLHSAYVDGDVYVQDIQDHLNELERSTGGRQLQATAVVDVLVCKSCSNGDRLDVYVVDGKIGTYQD